MNTEGEQVNYIPICPTVSVHLSYQPELVLPALIETEIDALWTKAEAESQVFNAPLFCLISHDYERIFGRFSEYRHFIASRSNPELREVLGIYPLSVSGITRCGDKILVGRRDAKLALYPGFLELVPSGSIETRVCQHGEVDFIMQLMWELEEEAHIAEKQVGRIFPIGLFYCSESGIYDLVMSIDCTMQEYELKEYESSSEYPLLRWMSVDEWEEELKSPDANIVPVSRAAWQVFRELEF